jgi:hypothetical protein
VNAIEGPGRPAAAATLVAAALTTLAGVGLSLPPLRVLIEQSMVWHMLVQMPLLVLAGWYVAAACAPVHGLLWNRFGLSGFMLAQCIVAYWMIPALVDRAVVLPSVDAAKLATLWLAGLALRLGYVQAPRLVQLFFIGYGLPMMAWLGLYLSSTDLRLCNAYSLESQIRAGWGLVGLAATLGTGWLLGIVVEGATRLTDQRLALDADANAVRSLMK